MCCFSECESHPGRPLTTHMLSVSEAMRNEAAKWPGPVRPEFGTFAYLVGALHDLGKCTTYFQNSRLRNGPVKRRELGNHAQLSALLAWPVLSHANAVLWPRSQQDVLLTASLASILRHHGFLPDFASGLLDFHDRSKHDIHGVIGMQLEAVDLNGLQSYMRQALDAIGAHGDRFNLPRSVAALLPMRRFCRKASGDGSMEGFVLSQLLFSLLVWADKVDAASGGNLPSRCPTLLPRDLVDRFRSQEFGLSEDPMSRLRDCVYRTVEETLLQHTEERLFTLTAPTGSGKTLAALNAAVKLRDTISAKRLVPPRIVYCLPYTSIIDQNFDVFQRVFESGDVPSNSAVLLKHHHLSTSHFTTAETTYPSDIAELLVEGWDSEVIVTTFVQLLESLVGNRNSMLRKVCRLPGAIVLLDEVQGIPREYWETVREVFTTYAKGLDTHFILMTATQPLIFDRSIACELLPNYEELFSQVDRYDLHLHFGNTIPIAEFKSHIARSVRNEPSLQVLIVMNTVQSSIDVYRYLRSELADMPEVTFFYLSTNITPLDRRLRLNQIREHKGPCVVVSTQVVEAGVDISLDVVHRDLAPLDSIIQAAGRCNRSGERPNRGRVYVWSIAPDEESRRRYSYIYGPILRNATTNLLQDEALIPESQLVKLGECYFHEIQRLGADAEIHELARKLKFEQLSEKFQLIRETGARQSFFVMARDDNDAKTIWDSYQVVSEIPDRWERREAFGGIKRDFFERVVHIRVPYGEAVEESVQLLTDDPAKGEYYDHETGYRGTGCAIF